MIKENENIKTEGWAFDADPKNDPTYPMKKTTGDDHRRLDYTRPIPQPVTTEVLRSNERTGMTSVFGTSAPPSGLSGAIRRIAFRYSEGSWGHWLPLMLADRINVIEGLAQDLREGIVPNIFKERGWSAEWKYNRPALIRKAIIRVALVSAVTAYFIYTRKKRRLLS
jgi:hypothetical protein